MKSQNTTLSQVASTYADSIIHSIQQEYPNQMQHMMTGPKDRPTPREAHPAFYGCFDWHSSVELHWVLIRLLRLVPHAFDTTETLKVLNAHLTPENLAQETAYLRSRPRFERPYGWGWALTFVHELTVWEDETAQKWLEAVRPLADVITDGFLAWLPKATYPIRVGMHSNSAFGLARSVPWARYLATQGDSRLLTAITKAAIQWYGTDRDYPAHDEPSGTDFLSPALTEGVTARSNPVSLNWMLLVITPPAVTDSPMRTGCWLPTVMLAVWLFRTIRDGLEIPLTSDFSAKAFSIALTFPAELRRV